MKDGRSHLKFKKNGKILSPKDMENKEEKE
jgi:hypothetical protein